MNARLNKGSILRTAKGILGIAEMIGMMLFWAAVTWGQSKPTLTDSATHTGATASIDPPGVQSSSATPVAKQKVAQNSSARASAPKGQSEGIKVHGHWTIEVRDPDGKVATRREFENSLANSLGGGAALLTAMLGRTVTTGSWQVFLFDSAAESNAVIMNEPNSEAAAACPTIVANLGSELGVASCSNNLTLSGPKGSGSSLIGNTLTFTGSGTVPQGFPASIGFVTTATLACATTDSPTACFNEPNTLNNFPLTARSLDGLNGDPLAVPVSANQTVAVTVVISFQ